MFNGARVRELNTPEVRKRIEADGAELLTGTPEEFARLIGTETARRESSRSDMLMSTSIGRGWAWVSSGASRSAARSGISL